MSIKPKSQGPAMDHSESDLKAAADAPAKRAAGMPQPAKPADAKACLKELMAAAAAGAQRQPPAISCQLALKIALFFDGTGNNLDADLHTLEHSNVARLYRAHPKDEFESGTYRLYIPGLGTYFKDIGDPGEDQGMAFGRYGEARLVWAMKKVDEIIAKYRGAHITGLHFALFGFSRGAALARAFAIRLAKRCDEKTWHWKDLQCPAGIYFMGLFDTVAAVGLAASAGLAALTRSMDWTPLENTLMQRRRDVDKGVGPTTGYGNKKPGLAFGPPGADPTPNNSNGHGAWADDLRLPMMVKRCVHFMAGHEVRNSFPLDSVRVGTQYPAGISIDERIYPGMHSDVGGGYRPGEGGKSLDPELLISLVPLNEMLKQARLAGVPLDVPKQEDIEMSPSMLKRWNAYMNHDSLSGARPIEAHVLAHMRLYYAWRFHRIHGNMSRPQRLGAEDIARQEQQCDKERAELQRRIAEAQQDPARLAAEAELKRAEAQARSAESAEFAARYGSDALRAQRRAALADARLRLAKAQKAFAEADDAHMRLNARLRTLADSGIRQSMDIYDKHLLLDADAIAERRNMYEDEPLRPHYARLMEAYDAEFGDTRVPRKRKDAQGRTVPGKSKGRGGLLGTQPDVLAFFDNHVHDSLAGFAMDATAASDPRVIYLGKNVKAQHAAAPVDSTESSTAVT